MAAPETDGQQGEQRTLINFGGNQTWAARCYRPRTEADVLGSWHATLPVGSGSSAPAIPGVTSRSPPTSRST